MNVGGVDVLNTFGDETKQGWAEGLSYLTKVKWLNLRPSQLGNFKRTTSEQSRKLTHNSFVNEVFRMFGTHRQTRLENHLKGETQWIENGGERSAARKYEMELLKKLNIGMDTQVADDDEMVKRTERQLLDIRSDKDKNETDPAKMCWV